MERVSPHTRTDTCGRQAEWIKTRHADKLEARLALTETVKKQAYTLRHDGYLSVGYIEAQKQGLLQDKYDNYRSSKTIVLYKNGKAAASARVCLLDPASKIPGAGAIPSNEMFDDEITELLQGLGAGNRPGRAVEITKLARHPDFMKDNDLVFAMFRMTGYLILHFDADVVLTSVRASHVPFYKRLGFQKIAEPRPYPELNVETALMACFRASYDGVQKNVPVMNALSPEDDIYPRFMGGELVPVFPQPQSGTPIPLPVPPSAHAHAPAAYA
jgi:hypothetical protein